MKSVLRSFLLAFPVMLALLGTPVGKAGAQDVMVSYQDFYDQLAPYGQWVYDAQYGNVFVPFVRPDFRPYFSDGHWVMTEYGNTWASDEPWGWACYHYGRWTFNPYYGWVWVPGYEWAPAWVSWRYGGGYAGWAPLGPGYYVGQPYSCPESWWVFVAPNYMYQPHYETYWRGPDYNYMYMHQTTVIENVYVDNGSHVQYYYGPRAADIQNVTHQPVQVYAVNNSNTPGAYAVNQNAVTVYRPAVDRQSVNNARPATVMQAAQPIGKPQGATLRQNSEPPPFRQEAQKFQAEHPAPPARTNEPGGQRGGMQQNEQHRFSEPPSRQPENNMEQNRPQPRNQPENNMQQNRQPQPRNQPENNMQQNREQPRSQPENNMQQNRQPQPPHNNPQPRSTPAPRNNPKPANQPKKEEHR